MDSTEVSRSLVAMEIGRDTMIGRITPSGTGPGRTIGLSSGVATGVMARGVVGGVVVVDIIITIGVKADCQASSAGA